MSLSLTSQKKQAVSLKDVNSQSLLRKKRRMWIAVNLSNIFHTFKCFPKEKSMLQWCSSLLDKLRDQNNLAEKRAYFSLQVTRSSFRGSGQELKAGSGSRSHRGMLPTSLFRYLSYTTHLSKDCTAHSRLDPSTSISN